MKSSKNNTLLWLEDNPKTVEGQIRLAREKFFVERVSHPLEFAEILNNPSYRVKAIVLDIMLYQVYDLGALGLEEVDTDLGYEAGWRILEHYLRAPSSNFKQIPVLVFSASPLVKEEEALLNKLNQQEGTPIVFIEKRERKVGEKNWHQKFQDWLTKVELEAFS